MLDNHLGLEPTPTIAPSASSFVQPPTLEESESEHLDALVLFDFTPTSEFELGVHGMFVPIDRSFGNTAMLDGMNVRILEPDDGSGWVKVADQDGNSGLIPSSYIQTQARGGSADTKSGERGTLSAHDFPFLLQHVHHLYH